MRGAHQAGSRPAVQHRCAGRARGGARRVREPRQCGHSWPASLAALRPPGLGRHGPQMWRPGGRPGKEGGGSRELSPAEAAPRTEPLPGPGSRWHTARAHSRCLMSTCGWRPSRDSGARPAPAVCLAPWPCAVGGGPGPTVAAVRRPLGPAEREGLSPAAAGTRRGNCSWQRAQRALRSWHRHLCNSMTAERRAPCLPSAGLRAAAAVFPAGD